MKNGRYSMNIAYFISAEHSLETYNILIGEMEKYGLGDNPVR